MPEDSGPESGSGLDSDLDPDETARLELPSLSGLFGRRGKKTPAEASRSGPEASRSGGEASGSGSEASLAAQDGTTDAPPAQTTEPDPPPLVSIFSRVRAAEATSTPATPTEADHEPGPEPQPEPEPDAEPVPQPAREPEPGAELVPQPEPEPRPEPEPDAEPVPQPDPAPAVHDEWEPAQPEHDDLTQVVSPRDVTAQDEPWDEGRDGARDEAVDVPAAAPSWWQRLLTRVPGRDASPPERDASDPERDASAGSRLTLPELSPLVAAAVTGVAVGLVGVLLTYASTRGCEAVRGVGSCGGAGIVLLIAILGLMVLAGHVLLAAWRLSDTLSTSFLGVAIVAVVVMLFLLDQTDRWWMFIVLPLVAAAAYAGSWWGTSRFGSSD